MASPMFCSLMVLSYLTAIFSDCIGVFRKIRFTNESSRLSLFMAFLEEKKTGSGPTDGIVTPEFTCTFHSRHNG